MIFSHAKEKFAASTTLRYQQLQHNFVIMIRILHGFCQSLFSYCLQLFAVLYFHKVYCKYELSPVSFFTTFTVYGLKIANPYFRG